MTVALYYGGSSTPVNVNEQLTGLRKTLLGATIARKQAVACWKFVWTRGGKIFASRNKTSEVVKINSQGVVDKMANETLSKRFITTRFCMVVYQQKCK